MNPLETYIETEAKQNDFSGVVLAKQYDKKIASSCHGYANKSDKRENNIHTRFGIASGCKIFTAIAVCQLVERGLISFESRLSDYLKKVEFPLFSSEITIHQLLTHSSGIPDYFDETIMDDFEELWKTQPMYTLRQLEDFVPMFRNLPMMWTPGERFHYNNAGYIVLGLLVEELSGMSFSDYVELHIFKPCGMEQSGYFTLDALPANCALGYIEEENGSWRSNIYSIPVKGGADGGAFVTAPDMQLFWNGLMNHTLLNPVLTSLLLTPHIHVNGEGYYGYGVWITLREEKVFKYHIMGYDPGVSFRSAIYPASGETVVVLCNASSGASQIFNLIDKHL
ncbi:serine hydrolase domain-containing protein [Paenibacillus sp. B2(2019)]|uniref:serine hydrolase domain-containing protein n=1 Tax=Paenibacillus sp. B2(2019) TaxID=2607754 RepID=UPI0011F3F581|nr:serine hydrolase [Paenibacillus sp. B2(2019)]KAA1181575.1 serine hydrolase [Paenibacillus sp. B2(2019)]